MKSILAPSKRFICTAIGVFALNLVSAAPGDISPPADMFTDAGNVAAADMQPSGDILRRRAVRINTGALKGATRPGALINFNLFAGTAYTGVVDTVQTRVKNGFTLVGHLQGRESSSFVLVANQDVVVMNLRPGPQGLTQVRYLGNGVHVVNQVDENLYGPCGNTSEHAIRLPNAQADLGAQGPRAETDSGTQIDILVVYTFAARTNAGGTAAIEGLIDLAFIESNTAYQQSLIIPRIRLVHKMEVTYTEVGDFNTDLNRLTNPGDGFLDEVQGLRDTYGADLVSLWITSPSSTCGIGWLMTTLSTGFEVNGFNVVRWDCATGNYSFAHELGHNMGCTHNRENASGPGLYSYSYGWRFVGTNGGQYRTIMAYEGAENSARIQRFSNPDVSYFGTPTGVPVGDALESNNALTINNTASTVANFRQGVAGTNDPPEIETHPVSQTVPLGAEVTFTVLVDGTPPFAYEWRTNNIPIPGANLDHYTISGVQSNHAGIYSVFVTNNFGTATSSNATLTLALPSTLAEALDAPSYVWNTGGSAFWTGQAITTHDGIDAGESGAIGDSQLSWFQTTVNGPLTLTFWWKVSSEWRFDFLSFRVNGVEQFSISGEVGWQQRVVSIPAGAQTIRWQFEKDFVDEDPVGANRGWVDQISLAAPISFGQALDNPGLTWTSSGNALWVPQTLTSHDGVDAAASGNIISDDISQFSRLQATVSGPSTLKFWWKVSSEATYDFLRFYRDGVQQTNITGERDWQQHTVSIPAGAHTIMWQYDKDFSDELPVGQDKGWVDQVTLTAASRIVSNSFVGGATPQFSLQYTGILGGSYTIQGSTNLKSWVNLTNIVNTNIMMPFVETGASNYNYRFYRVISP